MHSRCLSFSCSLASLAALAPCLGPSSSTASIYLPYLTTMDYRRFDRKMRWTEWKFEVAPSFGLASIFFPTDDLKVCREIPRVRISTKKAAAGLSDLLAALPLQVLRHHHHNTQSSSHPGWIARSRYYAQHNADWILLCPVSGGPVVFCGCPGRAENWYRTFSTNVQTCPPFFHKCTNVLQRRTANEAIGSQMISPFKCQVIDWTLLAIGFRLLNMGHLLRTMIRPKYGRY